jgi:hypothetical protein
MSIERKDLRLKLDADDHAGLQLLADAEDTDMSAWAEQLLKREIRRRVHAAIVLAKKAERLGIAGNSIPAER